jgi:hypothetical protein
MGRQGNRRFWYFGTDPREGIRLQRSPKLAPSAGEGEYLAWFSGEAVRDPKSVFGRCWYCEKRQVLPGFSDGRCLTCTTAELGERPAAARTYRTRRVLSRDELIHNAVKLVFAEAQRLRESSFSCKEFDASNDFQIRQLGDERRENRLYEIDPGELAATYARLVTRSSAGHREQAYQARKKAERSELAKQKLSARLQRRAKAHPLGLIPGSRSHRIVLALQGAPSTAKQVAEAIDGHVDDVRNDLCRLQRRGVTDKFQGLWLLSEKAESAVLSKPASLPIEITSGIRPLIPPSQAECVAYLEQMIWPYGFKCRACGLSGDPYRFDKRSSVVLRCRCCHANNSLLAGTCMQRTTTPLGVWFLGAWLVHTAGASLSTREFGDRLGVKRYATANAMLARLLAVPSEVQAMAAMIHANPQRLTA